MNEVSCISKQGDQLFCDAKDPISSGLTIDDFLSENFFSQSEGALFCMGAGGSTIAITWHLLQQSRESNRPSRIVVSDRSQSRLTHIQRFHEQIDTDIPIDYVDVKLHESNDQVLLRLPAKSLLINATGLGKDAPGSPLSNAALMPEQSVIWDLNYRGELIFLDQARAQQEARSLQIEDGWNYFIHGWTQAIAEVFHITIPTDGVDFDRLSDIALQVGKPGS
jgi:shikimate 5-dehydrogenase